MSKRTLAPAERMIDAYDRASSLTYAILARVTGSLSESQLTDALRRLERRHPLLRARVDRSGKEIELVPEEAAPIPLRVLDGSPELWRSMVTAALGERTWTDAGPRAELCWLRHSERDSTLVLSMHHLIGDGSSGIYAMRDLVQLASDPACSLEPLDQPGQNAFYPRRAQSWWWKLQARVMSYRSSRVSQRQRLRASDFDPSSPRRTHIARLHLSEAATTTLVQRARRDGTTVQGVLTAAIARALGQQLGAGPQPQRILHPVDLRRYLQTYHPSAPTVGEAVGYYVSSVETDHLVDLRLPLADLASEITASIRRRKEKNEPLLVANFTGPWLAEAAPTTGVPLEFRDLVERWVRITFALTNLGLIEDLGLKHAPAPLVVEDVIFVTASSVLTSFGGSATTYRGRLNLMLGWWEPAVSPEQGNAVVECVERELSSYLECALQAPLAESRPNLSA